MGIDKGNTIENVIYFDSVAGIQYPGVSGAEGGGNAVHTAYNIQATPAIVVITPDKLIHTKQIWPPNTQNVVDSVQMAGGILQPCITSIPENDSRDLITIGPNPVKSKAYINLHIIEAGEIDLSIYNLTGQKVFDNGPAYYYPGDYTISADLTREPKGFYFVQLKDESGMIKTKKIILSD